MDDPTGVTSLIQRLRGTAVDGEGWWLINTLSNESTFLISCHGSNNSEGVVGHGSGDCHQWSLGTALGLELWAADEGELVSLADVIRKQLL